MERTTRSLRCPEMCPSNRDKTPDFYAPSSNFALRFLLLGLLSQSAIIGAFSQAARCPDPTPVCARSFRHVHVFLLISLLNLYP